MYKQTPQVIACSFRWVCIAQVTNRIAPFEQRLLRKSSWRFRTHIRRTLTLSQSTKFKADQMFTRRIPRFYCVFQVRTGTLRRISYQTLRQLHPSLRSIPIACPSRAASGNAIPSDNDSPLPPNIFPTEGFKIIDSSTPVEEETLPFYRPELFYPVRLGEVFQNRYQVVAKLGYGASSTVWLGHDLMYAPFCSRCAQFPTSLLTCKFVSEQRYVALKIFVNRIPRNPELEVLQHLESIQSEHNGREFMRLLEASFQLQSSGGLHDVFVLRPLGLSLQALQRYQPNRVLYENVATSTAQCALIALNFLHEEAKVIYTGMNKLGAPNFNAPILKSKDWLRSSFRKSTTRNIQRVPFGTI